MFVTFALLTLSILALWLRGDDRAPLVKRFAWLILYLAAVAAALVTKIVQPPGLVWIIVFGSAGWVYSQPRTRRPARIIAVVVLLILATGLMTHQLPGFENPRVISGAHFSIGAIAYRLHLNFDKTSVGVLILGLCALPLARTAGWRATFTAAAPIAGAFIAALMVSSLLFGYVRFEPKFPASAPLWLWANLCLTCFAEEALFRGFIQTQLQRTWQNVPRGDWLALLVAAVLFGIAHLAGGLTYVGLATLAGVGYGWVYLRTGQIAAGILTHFALNTVHFFFFTYPALQRA